MEKKELWPYHYSVSLKLGHLQFPAQEKNILLQILESLPTLRRIVVNGDQRYNYLKRNASLALRSNGVYEVHGKDEKGEIAWKFEYVVEDRRSETTGKVISGERVSVAGSREVSRNKLTVPAIDHHAVDFLVCPDISRSCPSGPIRPG